ncbi:hypothetical protein GOBAR_DD17008 [Gossypium barbadense]|nr:hypothetical protein GOBAR_DD17008 [Gossypium barbadense]
MLSPINVNTYGVTQRDRAERQHWIIGDVHREVSIDLVEPEINGDEVNGEYQLVYFRRLDDEFNKVDKFYRAKAQAVSGDDLLGDKKERNTPTVEAKPSKPKPKVIVPAHLKYLTG